MTRGAGDVWSTDVPAAAARTRYLYVLDGERARPDPRSRFQPEGVHGPSQVVDPAAYRWRHDAPRRQLADYVIYELHIGTFTDEGTFAAAARHMRSLADDLGITAVEIMPVAAFPGDRNWGYDGVHLYAPCAAYGTADDLRALIDAAHEAGLSVVMDVVYNHLGPEGNYVNEFAPYFTATHRTLWGDALDYGQPEVRAWAIENALMWRDEYHVDALRLDAVHAIVDDSRRHVLAELCERLRPTVLIAETDLNDRVLFDGWGFDACWSDDFHHALHAVLTGERDGYYERFGDAPTLARAIGDGWIRGPHPERSRELAATRFVVADQTHDQVGNRARGDRLAHLVDITGARLAAVATLAAVPAVPLLFMGEEFAASSPFQYFTSHADPELGRAVAEGRRREYAEFAWQGEVPDPQDTRTFERSRLDHAERSRAPHAGVFRLYRDLLSLRRPHPDLGARGKDRCRAESRGDAVWIYRGERTLVVLNVGARDAVTVEPPWRLRLHSEDRRYGGSLEVPGLTVPPRSAAIFER